jgi:protein-L-isoaspartate(D-aspartate) O-methyltransferase
VLAAKSRAFSELAGITRMTDFAALRRMMVDGQVRTADVTDPRLLAAMLSVPRERFVPAERAALAYLDLDVSVTEPGAPVRRLLKPMELAKLIQAAGVSETDRVLDVGCTTGYSTALLARLAATVTGLEEDAGLARKATETLGAAGVANAKIVTGPLTRGLPGEAPYDLIVLQGSSEIVPEMLRSQLRDGGLLVCVLGRGQSGKAMLYRRIGDELSGRAVFDAAAPPLPGFVKPPEFVF